MDPIKLLVQSNLGRDETGEKEHRKAQRELDKAPVEFDYKRNGGIFLQQNKLS
jgi:hypothetical protein